MNNTSKPVCLIVCSDDRSRELAVILSPKATVYRRWSRNKKNWSYSVFGSNGWESTEEIDVPKNVDVLFFHTGEDDPSGIPGDRSFRKEFAFSTGGVSATEPPAGRKDAIPIQRRFPTGGCPIKPRHVAELLDFLNGSRKEQPIFCRHDETVPSLWALAIACQAYVSAGIGYGAIKPDDELIKHFGWDRLQVEAISRFSGRLSDLWPRMQNNAWWESSLGFCDDTGKTLVSDKCQVFLARLILDIELDVVARNELKVAADADLADQKADDLWRFLNSRTEAIDILALLRATRLDPNVVANAYKQVKDLLN